MANIRSCFTVAGRLVRVLPGLNLTGGVLEEVAHNASNIAGDYGLIFALDDFSAYRLIDRGRTDALLAAEITLVRRLLAQSDASVVPRQVAWQGTWMNASDS